MESLNSYRRSIKKLYRRSFFNGVGSIFSIPGNYFPAPDLSNPEIRDMEAMRSDWQAVGGYMWQAINKTKS